MLDLRTKFRIDALDLIDRGARIRVLQYALQVVHGCGEGVVAGVDAFKEFARAGEQISADRRGAAVQGCVQLLGSGQGAGIHVDHLVFGGDDAGHGIAADQRSSHRQQNDDEETVSQLRGKGRVPGHDVCSCSGPVPTGSRVITSYNRSQSSSANISSWMRTDAVIKRSGAAVSVLRIDSESA